MEDLEIYKVMLELLEDENNDLKNEIQHLKVLIGALRGYNSFLMDKNKELVSEYDNLTDINKRLN